MALSRRDHLRYLLALPLASIAGRAFANDWTPLAGTWSGMVEDEGGRASRFRLNITPAGEVTLVAVDIGLVDARATRISLNGAALDLEFASLGAAVRCALVSPDRIEAVLAAGGEVQKMSLVRGDLYPVASASLPLAAMTPAHLRALLRVSDAPAIGVGWATARGTETVLVDGIRALGAAAPVAPGDAWHIRSNTKSMTATLVALLVEAGWLRWTTTVGEVLTQVPGMQDAYREATLIDLLSHHAGLPRDVRRAGLRLTVSGLADARGERLAYARAALAEAPVAAPRTTTNYSNAGYVVVGGMLEQLTGTPWEVLMRAHLFAPLKMRSAGFGPPATPGRVDAPIGHARGRNALLRPWTDPGSADLPAALRPAGLVHAGLADQLRYLEAHRDRAPLLTAASWDKLHTAPFGDGYALGWGVDANGSLSHAGSNGMWYSTVAVDRPSGMVFAGALNAATPQCVSVLQQAQAAALLAGAPAAA